MKDSNQMDYLKIDTLLATYKAPEKKEEKKPDNKKGIGKLNLNFLNKDEGETKEDSVIPPSELTFENNLKSPFDIPKMGELIGRFPIKTIDETKINFVKIEDDTVKLPVKYTITHNEENLRKIEFLFDKKEDESFELFIPAGGLTDIYGQINDTLEFKFKTRKLEYYSTISMIFKNVRENSVVQLLNEKELVLDERTINGDTTLLYNYLAPSKYKFKLFYDHNANGVWDTGKYSELKQPETVFYYPFFPEVVETKGNMDYENTWDLYPKKQGNPVVPLTKAKMSEK